MTARFFRDTAIVCAVLALGAWAWRPDRPRLALGVVGGGALAGLAAWAIGGAVRGALEGAKRGENRRFLGGFALVKFFTRHVILALAAYGMMLRLQLDPIGMIVGVTSAVVAAAFEARRR